MWLMLQQDTPDDYVIGTGETHMVREFVKEAFAYVGLDWQAYVEVDPRYFRPTEVDCLQADATKARTKLHWESKMRFKELIAVMVDTDMEAIGLQPIGCGQRILETRFAGWHQWSSAVTSLYHNTQQEFE
jgi:GDPmannose 4,6-dehydratase